MSRTSIILLSIVACVFGALSLLGPTAYRGEAYAVNAVTAVAAAVFASIDLRRIVFSGQRGYEPTAHQASA